MKKCLRYCDINKMSRSRLNYIILAGCLLFSAPKESHAFMLIAASISRSAGNALETAVDPGHSAASSLVALLCVITLPLCFLDRNSSQGTTSFNERELAANGFSREEIRQIIEDRAQIAQSLETRGVQIQPSRNPRENSFASLERVIQEVHPRASQAYLNFLREQLDGITNP
jgi:hypothetical protein